MDPLRPRDRPLSPKKSPLVLNHSRLTPRSRQDPLEALGAAVPAVSQLPSRCRSPGTAAGPRRGPDLAAAARRDDMEHRKTSPGPGTTGAGGADAAGRGAGEVRGGGDGAGSWGRVAPPAAPPLSSTRASTPPPQARAAGIFLASLPPPRLRRSTPPTSNGQEATAALIAPALGLPFPSPSSSAADPTAAACAVGLRERCLGRLEGSTAAEARRGDPGAWGVLRGGGGPEAAGGCGVERMASVDARVAAALSAIARAHPPGSRVVAVAHGGSVGAAGRVAGAGAPPARPLRPLANAEAVVLSARASRPGRDDGNSTALGPPLAVVAWGVCTAASGVAGGGAGRSGGGAEGG